MSTKPKSKTIKLLESRYGKPSFGQLIASMRELNNLSQTELGEFIGSTRNYICRVEKGKSVVTVEQAIKFAKAFKMPVQYFVEAALEDLVKRAELKKYRVKLEKIA